VARAIDDNRSNIGASLRLAGAVVKRGPLSAAASCGQQCWTPNLTGLGQGYFAWVSGPVVMMGPFVGVTIHVLIAILLGLLGLATTSH
jgi:hypothetical protein